MVDKMLQLLIDPKIKHNFFNCFANKNTSNSTKGREIVKRRMGDKTHH